ncbi:MAG: hypothetical protein VKO21_03295 [Candidatus Sericytochromatia bacterium]|nr:hypothetical protein [Candidatus Sericytochromatia bacterium]
MGPDVLLGPRGLALAPSGSLFICDTDSHRILELPPQGSVRVWAGQAGIGFRDGSAEVAQFDGPCGIAVRPDGRVVVADHYNEEVREIGLDGTVSSLVPPRTVGTDFPFHGPNSVAVRPDGQIVVLERIFGRLSLLAPDQTVTHLAGGGYPTYLDGQQAAAGFSEPSKIFLTPDGKVFVGDAGNHRIRVVETDGRVWTLAGSGPVGSSGGGFADGPASGALFSRPMGVVVDLEGDVYVADSGNHRIRRIRPFRPR